MRWIVFVLQMAWLGCSAAQAMDLSRTDHVPVLHEGRVMPLDSYDRLNSAGREQLIDAAFNTLKIIPLLHHGENNWLTPADARALQFQDEEMLVAVDAWETIPEAIEAGDRQQVMDALATYHQFVTQRLGKHEAVRKMPLELQRNRLSLPRWLGIAFILYGVVIAGMRRCRRIWAGILLLLLCIGLVVDLLWMYEITGRIPLFTAGERMIFLGACAGGIGLLYGWVSRDKRLWVAGAIVAGVCCLTHVGIAMGSDVLAIVSREKLGSWTYPLFVALSAWSIAALTVIMVFIGVTFKLSEPERYLPHLRTLWVSVVMASGSALLFAALHMQGLYGRISITEEMRVMLVLFLIGSVSFVVERESYMPVKVWYGVSLIAGLISLLNLALAGL